jgi:hypothetical protein
MCSEHVKSQQLRFSRSYGQGIAARCDKGIESFAEAGLKHTAGAKQTQEPAAATVLATALH